MDFPFLLSIIVGYIGTWPLQLANAGSMGLLYLLQDREEVKAFLSLRMREMEQWGYFPYFLTKLDHWNNLPYYNIKLDHWNNPHYYKTKEEQWDDVRYYWTKILTKAFLIPVKTTEPVKTWSTSTTAIVFPDLMEQTVKMILTSAPQVPVKTKDLVQTWSMPTNAFVIVDSTVQILRRDHSQSSLKFVSKCPISSKLKKLLEKFDDVCGIYMQDGNCAYHCMCDSSKARLGGCFVKTETFFDYCLVYDPVDQSFKKDLATLWHSTFSRTYYSSSDTYVVCDPNNCLHLYNPSDRSGETTLSMLNPETTEMNGGDIQQVWSLQNWFLILLFAIVGVFVAFVILPKCGISSGTLNFAFTIFPCAGGTELGSGQRDHQDRSQIYQASLKNVSKCPNPSEYMYKTSEKCVDVCGSYIKDGNCAYHCMRDSSKTTLVEFCAKPKIFFDYCPEFDPVHHTIQKDQTTLCNPKSSLNYYNSSNIYFCDPNNCLHLSKSSDRFGETTLSTLMTETTEMNGGDIQEVWLLQNWFLILLSVAVVIIVVIISIVWGIRRKFVIFSARPGNKNYQEDVEKKMKKFLMVKM